MGYTASDLLGAGIAFLLSGLFLFARGHTFDRLSNAFEFRRRRMATRLTAAAPFSIRLAPIAACFLCIKRVAGLAFGPGLGRETLALR